jgi:hypothetical protein
MITSMSSFSTSLFAATTTATMGPATAALAADVELRSTKRRRLSETTGNVGNFVAGSFQLDAMFNDINHNEEEDAFPSIGWNFDDDEDEERTTADTIPLVSVPSAAQPATASSSFELSSCFKPSSLSSCRKRQNPGGMVRSKAFSSGLDAMTPTFESSCFQLESIAEALPSSSCSKLLLARKMYKLSSSSMPPRRKHVGPSYFAQSTLRMRA